VVDKLYKSKIAKQIRFPEGLINEDVEGFFLGLINASNIVLTNQVVYYYWENVNGISYKWFSRKQMDLLKVWENVCVICKETKPEWIYLAELNYKRAHLGLLTRLMLNSSQEDSLYEEEKDYLLCKLKQYSSCLLKSTIPNSRKLLLILMCFNYNATRKIFRMIKFDVYNIDRKG
jgi:hypothetical protein